MEKKIKCVIWDLDNTIWDGVLLESQGVVLKAGIKDIIKELDSRGILNSIASRNNFDDAISKLKEFGIEEYFLYPEINWNAKSESIRLIQKNLNIGMDTILFIDDQPFELDEVKSEHDEISIMNADKYTELLSNPRLMPEFIGPDSKRRRHMYLENIERVSDENNYKGSKKTFLASLNMKLIISSAKEEDLQRAQELTVRTNQLNATGQTYSYDELKGFIESEKYKLFICELEDKYGSYGKIGLALIEKFSTHLQLKLLLMSCRVMSRGVGTILLSYIMKLAKKEQKRLLADFRQTDRNKMMYLTYKFANFKEISNDNNGYIVFENCLSEIQEFPPYVEVIIE